MKLLEVYKDNRGFTLLEIIVVTGVFVGIVAMTSIMGMNSIGRGVVLEERDTLVTLLLGTRARALANVHELAQGVNIAPDAYTLFEGTSFGSSDPSTRRVVPKTSSVMVTSPNSDIVFTSLSGNVSSGVGTTTLSGDLYTTEIRIGSAGRIEW